MKTPPINMVYPYATVAGEDEVELRRRLEWLALDYLLNRRGEVITAYDMAINVWRQQPAAARQFGDGMVRTVISRLRSKIPELLIGRVINIGWVLA